MKLGWTSLGRVALLALVGGVVVGCTGTPFQDEVRVRTPYERYQVLRGENRPTKTMDTFGREQPNLRARLAPLGGS